MKRLVVLSAFVATNAMALDFETEWAKFKDDFARLASKVSIKTDVDVPIIGNVPVSDGEVKLVDPKSPDRIGLKLSTPQMREKVTDLYKRDDVVVYSATIR